MRPGGEAADGAGRSAGPAASAGSGVASSSEGRANMSRTHSQDVGPTPSDWDPSYRSGARLALSTLLHYTMSFLWDAHMVLL